MSDHLIPYLAGLFDGEGSVTLTFRNKKDKKGVSRRNYVLYVQLSNTDKKVLNMLKGGFGGSIYTHKSINKDDQVQFNYISFSWIASNYLALQFLKTMIPYLVIKREEAEEAVGYVDRNLPKGYQARNLARWGKDEAYLELITEIHADAEDTRSRIAVIRENKRERIHCGIT